MRQLIHDLLKWQQQAKPVALATVIHTWGSAPRGVGSTMAISAAGEMLGSVSGGCVEGAVVEAALSVLESGQPRMLKYGVADETAWEVGLACGGSIEIFVRPFDPKQLDFWQEDQSIAVGIVLRGPESVLGKALLLNEDGRSIGALTGDLHARAVGHLQGAIQRNQPAQVVYLTPEGDPHPVEFFIHLSHPAPTLIIIGGVHIAVGLVSLANTLGYSTVIIDPRRGFGNPQRFPHADHILNAWPDQALQAIKLTRSTAIAALTHDPKIDDPALIAALDSPAFYVGALGSQKTQAQRCQRLLEAGISAERIDRIHGPIGLDLGGRRPEDIALAIMAEIVQKFNAWRS